MGKKNIYAGAFALVAVVLLLSAFTLAMDYEYQLLLDRVVLIVAVCNIVVSLILLTVSTFIERLKDSAKTRYTIFLTSTMATSLITLFNPPHHIIASIVFAIIIAINITIIAQLTISGAFREEYEDN